MPARERYVILDALRGIAGLCVVILHISEPYWWRTQSTLSQVCGHGYLPVEFFLLLMGYMLSYAYDRRWQEGMGIVGFFKRRLVRLHPLVVSGAIIAAAVIMMQPGWCVWWGGASIRSLSPVGFVGIVLWCMTMVPVVGFGNLNPLNACTWTLYYEYAGNILYALGVRRLGKRTLLVCSAVSLVLLASLVFHVDFNRAFGTSLGLFDKIAARDFCSAVGGWEASELHVWCGFVRLMFPFFFGILLSRLGWKIRMKKGAFAIAVGVFALVMFAPFPYGIGLGELSWVNGVFEILAVTVVFPVLLMIGAGNPVPNGRLARMSVFLGELSYPLYMTHYPFMKIHHYLVANHFLSWSRIACFLTGVGEFVFLVAVSVLVMRFWDEPVRRFLQGRRGR